MTKKKVSEMEMEVIKMPSNYFFSVVLPVVSSF